METMVVFVSLMLGRLVLAPATTSGERLWRSGKFERNTRTRSSAAWLAQFEQLMQLLSWSPIQQTDGKDFTLPEKEEWFDPSGAKDLLTAFMEAVEAHKKAAKAAKTNLSAEKFAEWKVEAEADFWVQKGIGRYLRIPAVHLTPSSYGPASGDLGPLLEAAKAMIKVHREVQQGQNPQTQGPVTT